MFEILYNKKYYVDKNFLTPFQTRSLPEIIYNFDNNIQNKKLYTLIMYNPDTKHGDYIHWLVVNIKYSIKNGDVLIEYKGPQPPMNTEIHRYIFILFVQNNIVNINNFKNLNRITNFQDLLNRLQISNNAISSNYFLSQYQYGGRKYQTKTKIKINKTRNKRINTKKYKIKTYKINY